MLNNIQDVRKVKYPIFRPYQSATGPIKSTPKRLPIKKLVSAIVIRCAFPHTKLKRCTILSCKKNTFFNFFVSSQLGMVQNVQLTPYVLVNLIFECRRRQGGPLLGCDFLDNHILGRFHTYFQVPAILSKKVLIFCSKDC